jgi:hypothetical protein
MEHTTRRSYANEPDGDDGKPSRIALDNMPEGRAVQEKEMTEKKGISIEGIVAARDKQPYVVVYFNGQRAQLSIADTRNVALDLLQMASRTEADAMILKFFDKAEFPSGAGAALMLDFRKFRAELDAEPVENFTEEPTGGGHVQ